MSEAARSPANDTLPPHNLEAEESILGGILLDPGAIARVADRISPEAFYLKAHQDIYRAAISLYVQGKPTDLMTVTAWLEDRGTLESVGGVAKLAQLAEQTVSAINVDGYGALIGDKSTRRQLIGAGHEIVGLGYDTTQELETVLDRAEQKIFNLTQARQQGGLVPIAETLVETFDAIETRQAEAQLPGVKTDFYDLDALTGGLQKSDLVILAGRPAMGKTALGLNIARNIAADLKLPVAIFSLEMSKEQLAQRLLAAEGEIPSNRLRSGKIDGSDFDKLSTAIGRLSELPVYIDDTANTSIVQMRSQGRKLKAELGELGLILLDYLQLMDGDSDNRVQELSKITRGLKILARELKVPVLALSQLSRGVEQRTNKRPMLSDLRESGCLGGGARVALTDGTWVPMAELVGQAPFEVWAIAPETREIVRATATRAFATGTKAVWALQLADGRTLQATSNHRFWTPDGWRQLAQLQPGDRLAAWDRPCEDARRGSTQVLARATWVQIAGLEPAGTTAVFDLTVPGYCNFIANGIVAHNSIEQDADLVLMLYRDSYYNPDSPDRDVAELIVTKHRNGPTGTIKLLFSPELTQFRNMARGASY